MTFAQARDLITSLQSGDPVILSESGRESRMTVQRAAYQPDGFGSPGSLAVMVGYGPGRFNTRVSIDRITAGFCKLRRAE